MNEISKTIMNESFKAIENDYKNNKLFSEIGAVLSGVVTFVASTYLMHEYDPETANGLLTSIPILGVVGGYFSGKWNENNKQENKNFEKEKIELIKTYENLREPEQENFDNLIKHMDNLRFDNYEMFETSKKLISKNEKINDVLKIESKKDISDYLFRTQQLK